MGHQPGLPQRRGEFGALGGLEVSLTTIALAGLYALWLGERSSPRSGAPAPRLSPALPLFAYVAINALSLLVARDRELAGYELALLIQTFLLFVYIVSTVRTRHEVRFITTVLTASLLVESILIIAQHATGANFAFLGLSSHADTAAAATLGESRVGGTVGSPNTAASFLCMLLPLAIVQLVAPVSARVRRLSAAAVATGAWP